MNAGGYVKRSGPGVARVFGRIASELEGLEITVGIQGIEASATRDTDDGGTATMAEIATWNEYGIGVPERPFMRTAARRHGKKWAREFRLRMKEAIAQRRTVVQGAAIVGNIARADVQMTLTKGPWTPNAPYTIARKGSSRPLIDTGQMRQSIRYQVSRGAKVEDVG